MDIAEENNRKAKIAVWVITPNGLRLAKRLQAMDSNYTLFVSDHLETADLPRGTLVFKKLSKDIRCQFRQYHRHLFIFSTGIAVRIIAPLLVSKLKDPAVTVMDDRAYHVISLISGHIGGANELALKIAEHTGAVPVITTATDTNQVPAIDMIAQKAGLVIESPENIKHINMAFLKNEKIQLIDPLDLVSPHLDVQWHSDRTSPVGQRRVYCSYKTTSVPRETLILRPRVLHVGIGCNRGTPYEVVSEFLRETFKSAGLSALSIKQFGTTDIKSDEQGFQKLSKELGLPMKFYSKAELKSVRSIQNPSEMVQKHVGVPSVCEAAAILSAGDPVTNTEGRLILPKQKNKDVTLAVAIES